MNSLVTILIIFLTFDFVSAATFTNEVKAEIVESGIYHEVEPPKNSGSISNKMVVVQGRIEFTNHTDQIVAHKGVCFGFNYRLSGFSTNVPTTINILISHPEMTLPDGKKVSWETLPVRFTSEKAGKVHLVGDSFDEDYKLVPGDWTIAIYQGKRELVTKTFHI